MHYYSLLDRLHVQISTKTCMWAFNCRGSKHMHGESYADCIFKAPEGLIPGCSDTAREQVTREFHGRSWRSGSRSRGEGLQWWRGQWALVAGNEHPAANVIASSFVDWHVILGPSRGLYLPLPPTCFPLTFITTTDSNNQPTSLKTTPTTSTHQQNVCSQRQRT